MAEKPKDSRRVAGGTRERKGWERQASAVGTEEPRPKAEGLLEEVLRRENLMEALERVRSNRGAPGVDGMTVEALTPYLRGWVAYFRLSQVKNVFEELDQWIRRKLRCILWRQWKKPRTRAGKMIRLGVERVRAFDSAYNGHGPWWNAGASHMNAAITAKWLNQRGLTSLLAEHQRLACLA